MTSCVKHKIIFLEAKYRNYELAPRKTWKTYLNQWGRFSGATVNYHSPHRITSAVTHLTMPLVIMHIKLEGILAEGIGELCMIINIWQGSKYFFLALALLRASASINLLARI